MSGKTPVISRDTHVPAKRHMSLRIQENVPIPDAFLNEFQDILGDTVRNALRAKFGGSVRVGDAFEVSESATDTSNNFTINGVDTSGDPPKFCIMDGLMATIFEESWEYDSAANFLHEGVATLVAGTGPTTITDDHQDWQTPEDDLVDCRLLWTSGALNGSEFTITGYTQDTITVSGDSSSAGIGDTYKILPPALTTPGGARTDEVYLVCFWVDVNEEESDALDTVKIVDPALGEEVYHPRRMRVAVRVAEGGTTPADVPDAGNGVEYRYLHLATLNRTATADILTADITNENPAAGNLSAHQAASPIDHPDGSVTLAKLAADSVDGTKIADDAIDSEHYAPLSIDNEHIADSTITESKLAFSIASAADLDTHKTDNPIDHPDGSVTKVKLAVDSVDGTKIEDDAVDNEHLAASSVRGVTASGGDSVIQAGSIGSADLSSAAGTEAVTTTNLRSGAVTLPKRGNLTPTAKDPASNVVSVAAGTGVTPNGDAVWAGGDSPVHPVVSGAGQSRKDVVFLDEGGSLVLLKGEESAGTPVDPPCDGMPTVYQTLVNEEVTVAITSGEIIDLRGERAEMLTEALSMIGGLHMDYKDADEVTLSPGELVIKGVVNTDDDINTDLHSKGRIRRLTAATDYGISDLDEAESADTFYFVYLIATTGGLTPLVKLSSTAPTNGYHPSRPWRHVGTVLNDSSSNFVPFTKLDRDTTLYQDANAFLDGVGAMNVLNGGSSGTFVNVNCSAYVPPTARGVYLAIVPSSGTTQWELRVDGSADSDGFVRGTGEPTLVWLPINSGGTAGMIEYRIVGGGGNISINVAGFKERLS